MLLKKISLLSMIKKLMKKHRIKINYLAILIETIKLVKLLKSLKVVKNNLSLILLTLEL